MGNKIPVRSLCKYFSVSASRYHQWLEREELLSFKKKEKIVSEIKSIFYLSKGTYGSPRMHKELLESPKI